ncbi:MULTISPECIES: hemerythrin domain-containing protein [unclassified Lonepinella]|uniref:hemerythrin domain-containing protein n=1 Tax=unclassified Lonepinella TaxID=2642006 RepID=UPI0036DB953E
MINLEAQQFVSWDQPIEMLYACHGRVKNFYHQLSILPDYLAKHGVNQAVKNDVQQILNYFNIAAPLHHDDEEKDFFPAVAKYDAKTQQTIDELERQHFILHDNWHKLSTQLSELIQDQRDNIDAELITNFIAGYDVHIALEEPLFALGKDCISDAELESMGKVMAARRQL